ncbi:MAG: LysE family translocator, partial [Chloroflexota bacterium]
VGGGWVGAAKLVIGVFLGSTLWWLILSTGVSLLRGWVTPERMAWVNRISGGIIVALGLAALVSAFA